MIRENHDIWHELPEFRDKIAHLMEQDPRITRLVQRYHEITETVQDIQRHRRPADEHMVAALKKQRLQLKDTLYTLLRTH